MIDFNYKNPYEYKMVTPARMREVRAMLDTPVRRGAVMEFTDRFTDCPCVVRYDGKWYMFFL